VPYTVLEWLDGECLEVLLRCERAAGVRPRTVSEAIDLLNPIAQALAIAHERGVVHRDVKPGNIFVLAATRGEGPRSKLLDFGVAKVMRAASASAVHANAPRSFTPSYGAPEQFSPAYGSTGPWTDVFALALIVVELVVGHEAMQGDVETLGTLSCDPDVRPTPRSFGVTVSDEVECVLARALAVNPEDRYPDARALWDALARAAARYRGSALEVTWDPAEEVTWNLSSTLASGELARGVPMAPYGRRESVVKTAL
jgi:serine/threonine protein kinase